MGDSHQVFAGNGSADIAQGVIGLAAGMRGLRRACDLRSVCGLRGGRAGEEHADGQQALQGLIHGGMAW